LRNSYRERGISQFGTFATGVSATYANYNGLSCQNEFTDLKYANAGTWYGPSTNAYTCYVEYNITNSDASG